MSDPVLDGQDNTATVDTGANVAAGDTPAQAATGEDQGTEQTPEQLAEAKAAEEAANAALTPEQRAAKEAEAKEAAKPADGAPEAYAEFKAPEGVKLDETLLGEFSTIAKELNLSQDKAQRVVDLGPKLMQSIADRQAQMVVEVQAQWAADARADKEFGGEKFEENIGLAKKALTEFGTPELKTLLVNSGLGNHPEIIRLCHRIGKAIGNDGVVTGRQAGSPPDHAQRLYPSHKAK